MTTISAFDATPVTSTTGSSMQTALGGLDSDGFLKLLVAQLRFQNPMSPSDPTDMMLQTSQLAQLDTMQQVLALQRRDLGLQQAVAAAGLLGVEVQGHAPDGTAVSGTVETVRYTVSGPMLTVGDHELPLGNVAELHRA